jgi:hypothetical protein
VSNECSGTVHSLLPNACDHVVIDVSSDLDAQMAEQLADGAEVADPGDCQVANV